MKGRCEVCGLPPDDPHHSTEARVRRLEEHLGKAEAAIKQLSLQVDELLAWKGIRLRYGK